MRLLTTALLPVLLVASACGDGDETAAPATGAPTIPLEPPRTGDPGDSSLADVAVTVEGERVGLERVCEGADASVVAVTTAGRRVMVVREEGLALRMSTEGDTFTETTDVTETQVGIVTRYEGSVPVEGQPTPVSIEVRDDVALDRCEEVQS